jgi:glycerol-3-phosphate dehydrogenase
MPRIAVIGAGLMGHGIAQVFALAGHDVSIYDSVTANLDSAKARILGNLRDLGDDQSAVERVRPTADLAAAVGDTVHVISTLYCGRCRLCHRLCGLCCVHCPCLRRGHRRRRPLCHIIEGVRCHLRF